MGRNFSHRFTRQLLNSITKLRIEGISVIEMNASHECNRICLMEFSLVWTQFPVFLLNMANT